MSLQDLLFRSGDSEFHSLSLEQGTATILLTLGDSDELTVVTVQTNSVYISPVLARPIPENDSLRNGRLDLLDLTPIVTQENGIIIPPTDFGQFMTEVRQGLNLVYGRKLTETPYLLRGIGSSLLFACAIPSQADIHWRKLNS